MSIKENKRIQEGESTKRGNKTVLKILLTYYKKYI